MRIYTKFIEAVRSLPDDLHVGRWLNLRDCKRLESLPDGLYVCRWLDLRGCKQLKSLPRDLHVGDDLHLKGSGVTEIPKDVVIKGETEWTWQTPTSIQKDFPMRKS